MEDLEYKLFLQLAADLEESKERHIDKQTILLRKKTSELAREVSLLNEDRTRVSPPAFKKALIIIISALNNPADVVAIVGPLQNLFNRLYFKGSVSGARVETSDDSDDSRDNSNDGDGTDDSNNSNDSSDSSGSDEEEGRQEKRYTTLRKGKYRKVRNSNTSED